MERTQEQPKLAEYVAAHEWLESGAGKPFFETRTSLDWFIKVNRVELIENGALVPRRGRSGSLVHRERLARAVIEIHRRRALEKAQLDVSAAA